MNQIFSPGTFITGCNYWASHAGTAMWRDWRPEIVEQDLKRIAANGMRVMRVFPLWPDFQPLVLIHGEMYHGEKPLPDTEDGRAGLDSVMMDRFASFCDLAEKYGLKLVVGLVTGWMSGRLFKPAAFAAANPLKDCSVIQWEVRFVRTFVSRFKKHPAIGAWDLGNECNCMDGVTRAEAWNWTNSIASAIRLSDDSHPVVSGMHGLATGGNVSWTIQDQGELTDFLTTHPYPLFTPECNLEPMNSMRNGLHAAAESSLYSDLSGRPCIPEEVGTLGPMVCSDQRAGAYLRNALFSTWAHDQRALLWWCAFDQDLLKHTPYDYVALERELGLFRHDGTPKPTVGVLSEFSEFLHSLPFERLPRFQTDAVCLLSDTENQWIPAFGSFLLAKQAGFDLQFHSYRNIPDARFYLMPSLSGSCGIPKRYYEILLEKVRAGATLFVSCSDGFLQPFQSVFGAEIDARYKSAEAISFDLEGENGTICPEYRTTLLANGADVLLRDSTGNPLMTSHSFGKGRAVFCSFPLETLLVHTPGGVSGEHALPLHKIYRKAAEIAGVERTLTKEDPEIGITEHALDAETKIAVVINYSERSKEKIFRVDSAWRVARMIRGTENEIPGNDALVLELRRNKRENS